MSTVATRLMGTREGNCAQCGEQAFPQPSNGAWARTSNIQLWLAY
ncbi:hypothetical protein AB6813_20895 [bacterium RCC_150]